VRCQLTGAEHEGEVDTLTSAEELGATFFQQRVLIPSDGTAQLRLSWLSTGGWHGSGAGGTYDLRVAGQTLIHEQDVHVTIHLPPGTRVTHMTDGMTASGSTAEWRASPTRIVDLEVAFDSPFPLDIWRHLVDALS
jgi:hypothetical protein